MERVDLRATPIVSQLVLPLLCCCVLVVPPPPPRASTQHQADQLRKISEMHEEMMANQKRQQVQHRTRGA
jgi:hypothetical protein